MDKLKSPPLQPTRIRYIKLGRGGEFEQACLREGVNRIGFGTQKPEVFRLCETRSWDALVAFFIADGRDKITARRFTNEIRFFFEDDGSILWITFVGERLYWGLSSREKPKPAQDFRGVIRPMLNDWRNKDADGNPVTKGQLSGALTKFAMYRGTSCEVVEKAKDYVIRRINGDTIPEVRRAEALLRDTEAATVDLMRLLVPRDFETLVDLIFTTSGWRRLGPVGGVEKTRDLDLELPSTGERACVQVKSQTSQEQLEQYAKAWDRGVHNRMFFVYHSGQATAGNTGVTVIGPDALAKLVVDAGLVGWLVSKTR